MSLETSFNVLLNSFKRLICELVFSVCMLKPFNDMFVLVSPGRSQTLKRLMYWFASNYNFTVKTLMIYYYC